MSLPEEFMTARKAAIIFNEPTAFKSNVVTLDAAAKAHLRTHWDGKEQVKVHPLAKKFTFALACQMMLNVHDPDTIDVLGKL
ncbi:hypothetical protein AB3S75_016166 [Citrus x aurantiifolia]